MGAQTRMPARDDLAVARAHVRLGLWLTWFCAGAGIVYSLLTPGSPNRPGLIATFSGGVIVAAIATRATTWPVLGGGGGAAAAPLATGPTTEPLLPGRGREPFFIAWSNAYIALIAGLCLIDGGVG